MCRKWTYVLGLLMLGAAALYMWPRASVISQETHSACAQFESESSDETAVFRRVLKRYTEHYKSKTDIPDHVYDCFLFLAESDFSPAQYFVALLNEGAHVDPQIKLDESKIHHFLIESFSHGVQNSYLFLGVNKICQPRFLWNELPSLMKVRLLKNPSLVRVAGFYQLICGKIPIQDLLLATNLFAQSILVGDFTTIPDYRNALGKKVNGKPISVLSSIYAVRDEVCKNFNNLGGDNLRECIHRMSSGDILPLQGYLIKNFDKNSKHCRGNGIALLECHSKAVELEYLCVIRWQEKNKLVEFREAQEACITK